MADEHYQSVDSQRTLLKLRGTVTGRLGMAHWMSQQPDEALKYLTTLTNSPELSSNVSPTNLLIYTRQIGRIAVITQDPKTQQAAYEAVDALLKSGRIPPELVLANRLEIIRQTWPNPDATERIEALKELWRDDSFAESPRICVVGDELAMYYFFHVPPSTEEFKAISDPLLKRLQVLVNGTKGKESFSSDAMYVRNILMSLEVARIMKEPDAAKPVIKMFESVYRDQDIQITVPSYRSHANGRKLLSIYLREFPLHAETSKNRNLRNRLPTPTAND